MAKSGKRKRRWYLVFLALPIFMLLNCQKDPQVVSDPGAKARVETGNKVEAVFLQIETGVRSIFSERTGKDYMAFDPHRPRGGRLDPCIGDRRVFGNFYCSKGSQINADADYVRALVDENRTGSDLPYKVLATHLFGHHIQSILEPEKLAKLVQLQGTGKHSDPFVLRGELQADYFAGLTLARIAKDVKPEALKSAILLIEKVSKDRAKKFPKEFVLDPLTHGTVEQRVRWTMKGYKSGDWRKADTFNAKDL